MKSFMKIATICILLLTLNACMNTNKSQTTSLKDKDLVAVMKTNKGTIEIDLDTKHTPMTTANFIGLAQNNYYDGLIFHRIIKDFMIQGGDPTGTGMGGKSIYGEKFDDEFHPDLKNSPYTIAMANSGPNTNGSQFFINVAENNFLNNKHSVFGKVTSGMDNIDAISKVKTDSNDRPEKEVKIISVEIKERKGAKQIDFIFDTDTYIANIEAEKTKQAAEKKKKSLEIGDTVSLHYTGTYEDGEKFDSSLDRGEPIEFVVGSSGIISGLNKGVIGLKIGDKKSLKLSPEEAYGVYDEKNTQTVSKENMKSFEEQGVVIEKGATLKTGYGEIKILDINDTEVTLDTNHPLAGKTLLFDIEIMDIK